MADVNIPVGEVFTSPQLAGTGGILHVKKVYLNGLQFRDLKLVFDLARLLITPARILKPKKRTGNILKIISSTTIRRSPMGEFAIGTNTTAYVAALKYGIADKLPILIAEKWDRILLWAIPVTAGQRIHRYIIRMEKKSSPGIMRFPRLRKDDVMPCLLWLSYRYYHTL